MLLPGTMTGQLLGGASPLLAAEMQICLFCMMSSVSFTSVLISLSLAFHHAVFDTAYHRLDLQQVSSLKDRKVSVDVALYRAIYNLYLRMKSCLQSVAVPHRSYSDINMDESLSSTSNASNTSASKDFRSNYMILDSSQIQHKSKDIILTVRKLNILSNEDILFDGEGMTLDLYRGERISVEGPSGLGKTRILRAIALLDPIQSGLISLDNPANHVNNGERGNHMALDSSMNGNSFSMWRFIKSYVLSVKNYLYGSSSSSMTTHHRSRCIYIPQVRYYQKIEILIIDLLKFVDI